MGLSMLLGCGVVDVVVDDDVSDDDGVGGRGMLAGGIGISIKFVVVVK